MYRTAYRAAIRAARRFFCAYRATVTIDRRAVVYPCATLAEAVRWLELNNAAMRSYRVERCGLIRHRVILGA